MVRRKGKGMITPPQPVGEQYSAAWQAGEVDQRPLLDIVRADCLWRVTVVGAVSLAITYGTRGTIRLSGVLAPFSADLPGSVTVLATPLRAGASAVVTCSPVSGSSDPVARVVVPVGPIPVQVGAFTALVPSVLTIAGQAVSLPSGQRIIVLADSDVISGAGVGELVL